MFQTSHNDFYLVRIWLNKKIFLETQFLKPKSAIGWTDSPWMVLRPRRQRPQRPRQRRWACSPWPLLGAALGKKREILPQQHIPIHQNRQITSKNRAHRIIYHTAKIKISGETNYNSIIFEKKNWQESIVLLNKRFGGNNSVILPDLRENLGRMNRTI